jgi:hypothetical protein
MPSNEADIQLAIHAIKSNQIQGSKPAARVFNIPETTLRYRRAGRRARRDCTPNSKKLTMVEEEAVVRYILDLDTRGFPPSLAAVRDMADTLLALRGTERVGKHWPSNFVKRTDCLKTSWNRPYDRQRALCEDPAVIQAWFTLVEETKAKYGIVDEDVYNFDEAGFMMGKITTQLVVTRSDRKGRAKTIQPGNREWVTLIQAINAAGWAIPPFLIYAGKYHLSAWYDEDDLPRDWSIGVSNNGWTNNDLGCQWLKHFNQHTKTRVVGARRLLIFDGHGSHHSAEFEKICQENNIYTLCMPAHSSHLVQPLDVGCFSPLKKAYSRQIEGLMRCNINHITKLKFLPAFRAAFAQAFTPANIRSAFRGAGLVPLDPAVVIDRLNVQLRTPSPLLAPVEAPWQAKTPYNRDEIRAQSGFLCNSIRRRWRKSSSPASIIEAILQLQKGAEAGALKQALTDKRLTKLEQANEAANKRKGRKKKRIQKRGVLTRGEAEDLMAQREADDQIAREERQGGGQSGGSRQTKRRCSKCKETGHNTRTCQKDT